VTLPDSARVEVTDSFFPSARGLNGSGDSVAATFFWSSLDTAVIAVLDSTTGVSLGKKVGTGRLQARVDELRSSPQPIQVLARLDSLLPNGPVNDTVTAPDSISAALSVKAYATGGEAINRRVVYTATTFPAGSSTITFLPKDSVLTSSIGVASVQIKFAAGTLPDSVVVLATMRRLDGTQILYSPIRFVVEFQP
jgi:hypothetical protein